MSVNVKIATYMFCHRQWIKMQNNTKSSGGQRFVVTGLFCKDHPDAIVGFEEVEEGVAAITNELQVL